MNPTLCSTAPLFPSELAVAADDLVRDQVWSILSESYPPRHNLERRSEQRFPYPCLLELTPLAPDGAIQSSDAIVVVGKQLSERGLGFYHPHTLLYRRMIASLRSPSGKAAHLLIDLTWCRFTEHGWYESGGRFLRSPRSKIDDLTPGTAVSP